MNIKIRCLHHTTEEVEVMLNNDGYYENGTKACKKCMMENLSFYIDKFGYKYRSEKEYEKQKYKRAERKKIILEDWKMTKDRIAHFDKNLIMLRIQGIPIATAIQAGAFLISKDFSSKTICLPIVDFCLQNPQFSINITFINLLFFASALYLLPIFFLDWFYFRMLLLSVNHAIDIENIKDFYGDISITRSLTSKRLTNMHKWTSRAIYIIIIAVGILLGIFFKI